jgi:hypothetical protein
MEQVPGDDQVFAYNIRFSGRRKPLNRKKRQDQLHTLARKDLLLSLVSVVPARRSDAQLTPGMCIHELKIGSF